LADDIYLIQDRAINHDAISPMMLGPIKGCVGSAKQGACIVVCVQLRDAGGKRCTKPLVATIVTYFRKRGTYTVEPSSAAVELSR